MYGSLTAYRNHQLCFIVVISQKGASFLLMNRLIILSDYKEEDMKSDQTNIGKVILAGAGPGDPELLTLKAARYLGLADVILTDRLVSPEILLTHANAKAEIVYVGKQCGRGTST